MITNAQRVANFFAWMETETDYGAWDTSIKKEAEAKLLEILNEEEKQIYEEWKCPECGGKMISRKGQYGTFWGCAKYPDCRGTRDSMGRSKEERQAEKDKPREPGRWNVK